MHGCYDLVLVIIGREITMSSLREWAASISSEAYGSVAVSGWGKWKTASQVGSSVVDFADNLTTTLLVKVYICIVRGLECLNPRLKENAVFCQVNFCAVSVELNKVSAWYKFTLYLNFPQLF